MKKHLLISALLFVIAHASFGQNYMRDAGIRISDEVYLSYRTYYKQDMAVEFMLGYQDQGLRLMVLREYFQPVLQQHSENFNFVYGYGLHIGAAYTNKYRILFREYEHDYKLTALFGLNGLVGIEYQIPEVPILCAISLKPFFEYSWSQFFRINALDASFTLKYRF
ncbi:MAG: hypothetical protein MI922_27225 [Bacteroidales bacterium]|nr:hypothetical protein [Bacteroidales bacterium]